MDPLFRKTHISEGIPEFAASIEVADIIVADDGDLGGLVIIFVFLVVAGRNSGGDGQKSGDDELFKYRRFTINIGEKVIVILSKEALPVSC